MDRSGVPTGAGPVDAEAFAGMVTREFAEAEFAQRPDGAQRMAAESARRVFFHDCDAATARWAASQLRWQGPFIRRCAIARPHTH